MDIRERYIHEKKRRFNQYILKKRAKFLALTFSSRLQNIAFQKNHIKDLERVS
jgi:hypothetical protein